MRYTGYLTLGQLLKGVNIPNKRHPRFIVWENKYIQLTLFQVADNSLKISLEINEIPFLS